MGVVVGSLSSWRHLGADCGTHGPRVRGVVHVILVNGEPYGEVEMTVAALVNEMAIDQRGVAVALNGEIVRRSEWAEIIVRNGARVEIVTAAAGG